MRGIVALVFLFVLPVHGFLAARPGGVIGVGCELRGRGRLHMSSSVETKLQELGLSLPPVPEPKGSYVLFTRTGNLLFLAGHIPMPAGEPMITGKVGKDKTVEEAAEAAKIVALNLMATIKAAAGDLDKVRVLKLVGFVNCVPEFTSQPAVINGASNLIGEVMGENGVHSRSAVGTNSLPFDVPVEIEAVVEVLE